MIVRRLVVWLAVWLLVLSAAAAVRGVPDYYALLGVPRGADERAVRRAYKQAARTHHPDKNPDDADAPARFMAVQEAYEVLSDAAKRRNYDRFGHPDGPFGHASGGSGGGGGAYGAYSHDEVFREFFRHSARHAGGGGGGDGPPIESATPTLDAQAWFDDVLRGAQRRRDVWLVLFYARGVPASYRVAPHWERLAAGVRGDVRVARVHHPDDERLAVQAGLEHVPALVAVVDGRAAVYSDTRLEKRLVLAWLASLVPDRVLRVRSAAELAAFVRRHFDRTRALVFSELQRPSAALRIAAHHLQDDVAVAFVSRRVCADFARIAVQYGVRGAPALVALRQRDRAQHVPLRRGAIADALRSVRYQRVPRLREHNFDELCGAESGHTCFVFVERESVDDDALADAFTNADSTLARALTLLGAAPQCSAGKGPLRCVWLAAHDELAFLAAVGASDAAVDALALQRRTAADTGAAECSVVLAPHTFAASAGSSGARDVLGALTRQHAALAALDTLPPRQWRVQHFAHDAPPLADQRSWSEAAHEHWLSLKMWFARTIGLNSLVSTLMIAYSLYSLCCGGGRRRSADGASAAEQERQRAADLRMFPSSHDWLHEARARGGSADFDAYAQLQRITAPLSPAAFGESSLRWLAFNRTFLDLLRQSTGTYQYVVVAIERDQPLSAVCAEHCRFLILKQLQCKAMYHTQFALATINVHMQPSACRVLQMLNESSESSRRPAAANAERSSARDTWSTLPKLMAVDVRARPMRGTFCRANTLRSSATSQWLDLLMRNRLPSSSGIWFDFAPEILDE